MKTLQDRLNSGEVTVVEQGQQKVTDKVTGFVYNGEYRILSDGRKQWRQLELGNRVSPFWDWQDCPHR